MTNSSHLQTLSTHLWNIFDKSNDQLDVTARVQEVQPVPSGCENQDEEDNDSNSKTSQDTSGHCRDPLIRTLDRRKQFRDLLNDQSHTGYLESPSEHFSVGYNCYQRLSDVWRE